MGMGLSDSIGRLKTVVRPNRTQQRVVFDDANRLTDRFEELYIGGGKVATLWQANHQYYDDNRLKNVTRAPLDKTLTSPSSSTLTYDDDNQIDTYNGATVSRDLDGNLHSAPINGTALGTLVWDQRNRLRMIVGGTVYTYDAENRRKTSMTNGQLTKYIWSRGAKLDRLLAKVNPDQSITRYIYGVGLLYEETTDASGSVVSTLFYHFDWRGNTVALSTIDGNVVARMSYSPYGERTIQSGTVNTPFCFNGQWGVMTETSGLLCMQARFYSPVFCRFLNEDPAGLAGGINLYAFAAGDPIDLMDPFGLGSQSTSMWSGAGAAALDGGARYANALTSGVINAPQNLANAVGATAGYVVNLFDSSTRAVTAADTVQAVKSLGSAQAWQAAGEHFISPEGIAETVLMIEFTLAAGLKGGNCFPAGTKVSTSHGDVNIEDIKVGDLVYAYDFATEAVVVSKVTETPRHFTYNWMSVSVDGETIRSTRGHRFWVESEKGWVEAVDLKEGMSLRLSDGRIAPITAVSLTNLAHSEATYNLEIENQHTYFVGQHHVLVHNPYPVSPQYPPATAVGENFQFNFDTSAGYQNSRAAGIRRAISGGFVNPNDSPFHHINSVDANPNLAAEPANIKGQGSFANHLETHGGKFRNPTSGSLNPGCY